MGVTLKSDIDRFSQAFHKVPKSIASSIYAGFVQNKLLKYSLEAAKKDPGFFYSQRLLQHVERYKSMKGILDQNPFHSQPDHFQRQDLILFGQNIVNCAHRMLELSKISFVGFEAELATQQELDVFAKIHICFVKMISQYQDSALLTEGVIDLLYDSLEAFPQSYLKKQYKIIQQYQDAGLRLYKDWLSYRIKAGSPLKDIALDVPRVKLISFIKGRAVELNEECPKLEMGEIKVLSRLCDPDLLIKEPFFLKPKSLKEALLRLASHPQDTFLASLYLFRDPEISVVGELERINLTSWPLSWIKSWLSQALICPEIAFLEKSLELIARDKKQHELLLPLVEIALFHKPVATKVFFGYFNETYLPYIPHDVYVKFLTKLLDQKSLELFSELIYLRPLRASEAHGLIAEAISDNDKDLLEMLIDIFEDVFSNKKFVRKLYESCCDEGKFECAFIIKKHFPFVLLTPPSPKTASQKAPPVSLECQQLLQAPNLASFERMYRLSKLRLHAHDQLPICLWLIDHAPEDRISSFFRKGLWSEQDILKIMSHYGRKFAKIPLWCLEHGSLKSFSHEKVANLMKGLVDTFDFKSFFASLFMQRRFSEESLYFTFQSFATKKFYKGLEVFKYSSAITQKDWDDLLLSWITARDIASIKAFIHPNFPKLSPSHREHVMVFVKQDKELETFAKLLFWDSTHEVMGQSTEFSTTGLCLVPTSPLFDPAIFIRNKLLQKVASGLKK